MSIELAVLVSVVSVQTVTPCQYGYLSIYGLEHDMVRELNEQEYMSLAGTYGITHFMGGCQGSDKTHEIYLINNKVYLVSADEVAKIEGFRLIQEQEAKDYCETLQLDK